MAVEDDAAVADAVAEPGVAGAKTADADDDDDDDDDADDEDVSSTEAALLVDAGCRLGLGLAMPTSLLALLPSKEAAGEGNVVPVPAATDEASPALGADPTAAADEATAEEEEPTAAVGEAIGADGTAVADPRADPLAVPEAVLTPLTRASASRRAASTLAASTSSGEPHTRRTSSKSSPLLLALLLLPATPPTLEPSELPCGAEETASCMALPSSAACFFSTRTEPHVKIDMKKSPTLVALSETAVPALSAKALKPLPSRSLAAPFPLLRRSKGTESLSAAALSAPGEAAVEAASRSSRMRACVGSTGGSAASIAASSCARVILPVRKRPFDLSVRSR